MTGQIFVLAGYSPVYCCVCKYKMMLATMHNKVDYHNIMK